MSRPWRRHPNISKYPRKYTDHVNTNKRNNIQNYNFFLNYKTVPPSEGLNSFLAQSAGELWPSGEMAKIAFCRTWNLPQFLFFSHNFGSRYAKKPIKGSGDSDHSLVFNKNLSPKNGSLDCRPKIARWVLHIWNLQEKFTFVYCILIPSRKCIAM